MVKGLARDLILDAAEKLFAEQGVQAVSLRAVNAAAGVSAGVLHYHFGHREALVEALIDRRMGLLMAHRQALLAPLTKQANPGIDAIIEALVHPLADFVLNGGDAGQRYVQLIAHLYSDRSAALDKVSRLYIEDTTAYFPVLLQRACPQLSVTSINWRLAAANNAMLYTLAELHAPPRSWQQQDSSQKQPDTEQIIETLKRFIAGGFLAA